MHHHLLQSIYDAIKLILYSIHLSRSQLVILLLLLLEVIPLMGKVYGRQVEDQTAQHQSLPSQRLKEIGMWLWSLLHTQKPTLQRTYDYSLTQSLLLVMTTSQFVEAEVFREW